MPTSSEYKKQAALHRQIAEGLDLAAKAQENLESFQSGNGLRLTLPSRRAELSSLSGKDAIAAILSEAGQPLHKREIAARLSDGGKAIGANTLGIYLSKDDRFVSRGRGTWGLSE